MEKGKKRNTKQMSNKTTELQEYFPESIESHKNYHRNKSCSMPKEKKQQKN